MSARRSQSRKIQGDDDQQISMEFVFPQNRLKIMFGLFLGLFLLLLVRIFYVQVIKADAIMALSKGQHMVPVTLQAKRGEILDRNGRVIVANVKATTYAIDITKVKNKHGIATALFLAIGESIEYWEKKIEQGKGQYTLLARDVTARHPMLDTIKDPGFIRQPTYKRSYVYGSGAAQVVGFTDTEKRGLAGLELMLDSLLRGVDGKTYMRRDAVGNLYYSHEIPVLEPTDGHSTMLTLDIELQRMAEYELSEGIRTSQAEGGTVIALEPGTGEVLAMASWPTFDPHDRKSAMPDAIRLRGITDMYEPGSTFKLVTACAALEEGIIKPESMVNGNNGTLKVGDYEIKDSHPIGKVRFTEALEQSSNIVFAKLSDKIDDFKFYKYARDFGFGIILGIDFPGEVAGTMKRPKQFNATTKKFMAYGYELGATALQMVNAYSTIANAGVMMRPFIVKKIMNSGQQILSETKVQRIRTVLSEKTAKTMSSMLTRVVEFGTGKEAQISGLRIAGKTGTAQQLVNGQYSKQDYTASFVGFFPAEAPKVAMIVMLHKPKASIYGGTTSAPIFKKIAQKWITASRIPVTNVEESNEQVRKRVQDSSIVPDLRGLTYANAKELLHDVGLRIKGSENGTVISQSKKPGIWLEKGKIVDVHTNVSATPVQQSKSFAFDNNHSIKPEQQHIKKNVLKPMPDVRGMSVRRALAVLHSSGYKARLVGKGKVISQVRSKVDAKECVLLAR
ncbi:MAG: penicillin-binding transpeptidase domain-containing protein [Candidatus Kapaibacteriota bacterium]